MRKLLYVLPAVLLFGVSAAGAQNQPGHVDSEQDKGAAPQAQPKQASPKNSAPITSAQAVASAKDDQPVKLRGQIVSQKSRNEYVFSDGTGNVDVEIGARAFKGDNKQLKAGTQVEIVGEVDTRRKQQPKVEAKSVTIAASSGSPSGSGAPMNEPSGRSSSGSGRY